MLCCCFCFGCISRLFLGFCILVGRCLLGSLLCLPIWVCLGLLFRSLGGFLFLLFLVFCLLLIRMRFLCSL